MNPNLIGLGLAGYGVYLTHFLMTTSGDVSATGWLKALGALLAGGGIVTYNSVGKVKELLSNYRASPSLPVDKPQVADEVNTNVLEPVAGITMSVEKSKDQDVLYYLSERLKSSQEGLDYCRKINDLLFSIHHDKSNI